MCVGGGGGGEGGEAGGGVPVQKYNEIPVVTRYLCMLNEQTSRTYSDGVYVCTNPQDT